MSLRNRDNNSTAGSAAIRNATRTSTRCQAVFVSGDSEVHAMPWDERVKANIKGCCKRFFCCKKSDSTDIETGSGDGGDGNAQKHKTYRLEATTTTFRQALSNLFCRWCCCRQAVASQLTKRFSNPNQRLAIYLHWMFRVNFLFLFVVMCTTFFLLVLLFAAIIVGAGHLDPECVRVNDSEIGAESSYVADAFGLSWTTFSTVGYGSSYPALGHQNDSPSNCTFITFVCALESFLGILYSGFCGAILFGKVLRIQSHAQVIFSDPLVIRYGSGVSESTAGGGAALMQADADDSSDDDDDGIGNDFSYDAKSEELTSSNVDVILPRKHARVKIKKSSTGKKKRHKKQSKIPCPVIEFRVVNRLFSEVGGEIIDATLNVVANVDANDADPDLRDALDSDRQRHLSNATSDSTTAGSTTAGDSGRVRQNSNASSLADSDTNNSDSGRGNDASTRSGKSDFWSGRTNALAALKNKSIGSLLKRSNGAGTSFRLGSLGGVTSDRTTSTTSTFPPSGRFGFGQHTAVDEDPSSRFVQKRIFSKMLVEPSDHPFFKRVWLARHTLDENSPILKPRVRRQIHRNSGYWPERLNSYQKVRDSIQFNQILVSLNGVCNVSASSVYAQKIYDYVDINVGYHFVNVLYLENGALKVDTDLINDVREQKGGGGEPLIFGE